jgi:hypothetical protein
MMRWSLRASSFGFGLACLLLCSTPASAQSAFSGVVKDTSGAVLPGVTIEASSPVLIEKVRTAVTDDQGRYTITELRPGTYTLVFTLAGFNVFKRDAVELPANFTSPINVELKVGALEETVTVTGESPVVDVKSTQKTTVLSRDMLDSLPTARNYSGLAALMPGVRMSNTDVGGNQQMEQIYMTVHGSRQTDVSVQVDGMSLNSLMSDGQVQAYFSDVANAEVSYQTNGVGADVSSGGVRINMIPKEGGNKLSGQAFLGGTNGSWQGDNVTPELRARGLAQGSKVDLITDVNAALGGRIMRDRLWFFGTWRRIATNSIIANNFYKDGSPGIEDQWIQNQMVRLTWQINPKNKFTIYHDRYPKFKGHEMGALTDPETAAGRRNPENARYYTSQAKWTNTLTSRLLLEAGFSVNSEYYTAKYQPGIGKERGTPEWLTTIGKNDLVLLTNYDGRTAAASGVNPVKEVASAAASYVTGGHAFKTGVQWGFGPYHLDRDINGDIVQLYRNGVPDSVRVYNTPARTYEQLNADLGIFAQDSWSLNRLTLNAGVRLEYFNAMIKEQDVVAGRFAPARHFDEMRDLPNWFNITPRLGASYDVFGNGRTAIKGTFNKYMAGQGLGWTQRYNPLQLQTDTRTWTDVNRDNVAQDGEIGPSNNRAFGLPFQTRRPEAGLAREYDLEYSASIQHEVVRGVSASASWYRRGTYNMSRTDNLLVSLSDYTAVSVVSPVNGEVFTAYNLLAVKQGLVDQLDVTSNDSNQRRRTYNGVELGVSARRGPASFFGGWTMDRTINVQCDDRSDPNFPNAVVTIAGTSRFCDQSKLGLPLLHEFKLSGSYLLPYGMQVNAALQSYAGRELLTKWSISRTTRYAANCKGPCTPGALVIPGLTPASLVLDLVAPGQEYYGRQNQLDVGFRKIFRLGKYQYSGQADIFNVMNFSYVKLQNTTFGTSLGQPLDVLQPRLLRLAMQMRF